MALKKTITTAQGFTADDAYFRVEEVKLSGKDKIAFSVRGYKDDSGLPAFEDRPLTCDYDIEGKNPIAQAYDHVKTLPEFAGAVDC
jgi:hypothetical protein